MRRVTFLRLRLGKTLLADLALDVEADQVAFGGLALLLAGLAGSQSEIVESFLDVLVGDGLGLGNLDLGGFVVAQLDLGSHQHLGGEEEGLALLEGLLGVGHSGDGAVARLLDGLVVASREELALDFPVEALLADVVGQDLEGGLALAETGDADVAGELPPDRPERGVDDLLGDLDTE